MVPQAYNADKERIRQIVISRLSFMVQCAVEPELKKEFYADPIPFMRRQGQKIPENAKKIAVDVDAESISLAGDHDFLSASGRNRWQKSLGRAV